MERAPETTSKGINPATAFAVVAAVLVAIGLTWFFVKPEPAEPVPPSTPTPADFSLTNEEAIARFNELDQLRIQAYETTDVSLISSFLTTDSPIRRNVESEIARLHRDDVSPEMQIEQKALKIITNGDEVQLRQTVILDVLFSQNGENVTRGGGAERQVILWTLRPESNTWLIYDATIQDARRIR